jgi:hypothetical protein
MLPLMQVVDFLNPYFNIFILVNLVQNFNFKLKVRVSYILAQTTKVIYFKFKVLHRIIKVFNKRL